MVEIFVSYSHFDDRWFASGSEYALIPWLEKILARDGVSLWYDRSDVAGLKAGDEFRRQIEERIDSADIALLLISEAFFASEFIQVVELPRIQARAERGEIVVIPLLLEPCAWQRFDFVAQRQMLPGKPTPLIDYTENFRSWTHGRAEVLAGIRARIPQKGAAPRKPSTGGVTSPPGSSLPNWLMKLRVLLAGVESSTADSAREEQAAEEKTRLEAEALFQAEAQRRKEAEERARQEADARTREEARRREVEERARKEAEARAQEEARRKEVEERARKESEARAQEEARRKEVEERARKESEARAQEEARRKEVEERARKESEARAQEEARRKEVEERARKESEARAQEEARRKEAETRFRKEAEARAQEEVKRQEAEARLRKETEARAQAESERSAAEAAMRRRESEVQAAREAEARAEADLASLFDAALAALNDGNLPAAKDSLAGVVRRRPHYVRHGQQAATLLREVKQAQRARLRVARAEQRQRWFTSTRTRFAAKRSILLRASVALVALVLIAVALAPNLLRGPTPPVTPTLPPIPAPVVADKPTATQLARAPTVRATPTLLSPTPQTELTAPPTAASTPARQATPADLKPVTFYWQSVPTEKQDFTEPAPGWGDVTGQGTSWKTVDGAYQVTIDQPRTTSWIWHTKDVGDFSATVDVRTVLPHRDAHAGLILRAEGRGEDQYRVDYLPGQGVELVRMADNQTVVLLPRSPLPGTAVTDTVRLGVEALGPQLRITVDGQPMGIVTDTTHLRGDLALFATSGSQAGAILAFDYFEFTPAAWEVVTKTLIPYVDPQLRFSAYVPADWTPMEDSHGVSFSSPDELGLLLARQVDTASSEDTPEEVARKFIEEMRYLFRNLVEVDARDRQLGDMPAHMKQLTFDIFQSPNSKGQVIAVSAGGTGYAAGAGAVNTVEPALRPLLEAFLESFRVGAQPAVPPIVPPPLASTPSAPAVAVPRSDINVRQGPGVGYPVIDAARQGKEYTVTGRNGAGDWLQVDLGRRRGWISAKLVTVHSGLRTTPGTAEPTTTP